MLDEITVDVNMAGLMFQRGRIMLIEMNLFWR